MLPKQGKRRVQASRQNTRRSTAGPLKKSKFDERYYKENQKSWIFQYICYGLIVVGIVITIIFIGSIASNKDNKTKTKSTLPPFNHFNVDDITDLVKNTKEKEIEIVSNVNVNANINANAVELTFRIYTNEHCDESDSTQFLSIQKRSKDIAKDSIGSDCALCFKFCNTKMNENGNDIDISLRGFISSVRIISSRAQMSGQLDLFGDCAFNTYHSSVFEFEGCVRLYEWPLTQAIRVRRNYLDLAQTVAPPIDSKQLPPMQEHLTMPRDDSNDAVAKSYLIVYSCESSEYCAFQAQANYYGYLTSQQHPTKSSFLRLLSSGEPDDMASYIPTFTAPRNLYSRRYSPYNKADILVKWFEYKQDAKAEIIVVIDPDNWIIRDLTHWTIQVKEGEAIGEAAWFHGNGLVNELWSEVCANNCQYALDMVGVPYLVHRNDLEKIAPYFKLYIDIMKEREERDASFLNKYKGIQMGWGTEMFAYIFGAAHAGVKHRVVRGIQRRDVSSRPNTVEEELSIDMIHMGRAWWPSDYPLARKYQHTEGAAWRRFGIQVWCKCNYTASDIIPWPMPPRDRIDFQSYHTLYLLYYGRQYFGELPTSQYRKRSKRYHEPYP